MRTSRLFILTIIMLITTHYSIAGEKYQVSTDVLNIRSGPSKNYPTIGQLKRNEIVNVINKHSSDWYKIEFNGQTGYVSSRHLISQDNSSLTTYDKLYYYAGGITIILILLGFILKGAALKNYGGTLVLLATFFYYIVGWFIHFLFAAVAKPPIDGGTILVSTILTYILAMVVGILSLISFFKNVGLGIIIISTTIAIIDYLTGALLGTILSIISLIGGILITIGYSQIKTIKYLRTGIMD